MAETPKTDWIEVIWYDPRAQDAFAGKMLDASLAFMDKLEIGDRLYVTTEPQSSSDVKNYDAGWNAALQQSANIALSIDSRRGNEQEIAIAIMRLTKDTSNG